MKLYTNKLSPNGKRLRALMNELDVAHEVVEVDLATGKNRSPDYLAKNPNGKVPMLEVDGEALWESPAVMLYLAQRHGGGRLVPSDPRRHAEALRWMFWNASHLETAIFTVARERWAKPTFFKQEPDPAQVAAGTRDFERFAPILDAHLAGKSFLLGAEPSVADFALAGPLEMADNVGLDVARHPHVAAWLTRMQARPAWKAA
jgi:glutathione S-transferase